MNFLISDFTARLQNAINTKKLKVSVVRSTFIFKLLNIFYKKGLLVGYRADHKKINVFLKYKFGKSVLPKFKIVSKPGCRRFVNIFNLMKLYSNHSIVIISTTKGLVLYEDAVRLNLGGEVILYF